MIIWYSDRSYVVLTVSLVRTHMSNWRKSKSTFCRGRHWVIHFLDQSFAETFDESLIRTEAKDQPKSEVVVSFRLSNSLRVLLRPNFGPSDR